MIPLSDKKIRRTPIFLFRIFADKHNGIKEEVKFESAI